TNFGAQVIRECHRLGLVVDVAHGTEVMVTQAAKVATKPLLLSHTALAGSKAMGSTPLTGRQITPEHARAVAATGGAIGIWHFFPSLERYVDGLKEMVDVVGGVNHVCVGTDQQTTAGGAPGLWPLRPRRGPAAAEGVHRRRGGQGRRRELRPHLHEVGGGLTESRIIQ
ncbi:MAG TPA: membrane dipeptidase, partial [Vicinamibacteria bacterium]|nr:membrane dipeptidase [Vicinamibacteria bacterium]